MQAEELELSLPQARLRAKRWGSPSQPPLLALHGWLDNAASFDRLAPLLAERWQVVALDLRGHGRSAHLPPGVWYHYVDAFDDIGATFEYFGWQRASLLGHSLGATLVSLYAALEPARIDQLLLVEGLGPLSTRPEDALARLRDALAERLRFRARRPLRVFPTLDDAVAARARAGGLSAAAARPIVARGLEQVVGGWVWSSDPRLTLASAVRFTEAEILVMLGAIRAPTTLVLADPPTPYLQPPLMTPRIASVSGIRVERLAGHHHLHLEQPAQVAQLLLAPPPRA